MGKITDLIRRVLESNEWNFEEHPNEQSDTTTFIFGIKGDNVHMRVHIVVDEEIERFMVRCYPDWYVPKSHRTEILKLLNQLNITRWLTRVGLDPEDGELVYVWAVICRNIAMTPDNAQDYIFSTISMADDETAEVLKAVYSNNPSSEKDIADGGMLPWTPRSDN